MRQNSRAARQKTTEHVCPEPRRSVTIRTASMHLRTGAWGKKSIAKLPNLSKCVEATLLTLPSPKGETPPPGEGAAQRRMRGVHRQNETALLTRAYAGCSLPRSPHGGVLAMFQTQLGRLGPAESAARE